MSKKSNKPKKAFYALNDNGDFTRHTLGREEESSEDSPTPGEGGPAAWARGEHGERPPTPEELRRYPVVEEPGGVRVRRIKSRALHREPSSASVQSQDSVEEIPVPRDSRDYRVQRDTRETPGPRDTRVQRDTRGQRGTRAHRPGGKGNVEEDTVKVKPREVEMQPSEFRQSSAKCWGTFSNLGFLDDGEGVEDGAAGDLEELFSGMTRGVRRAEERLARWEALRQTVTENRELVRQEIDKRKKKLLKRIKDHAQVMHERLDALITPHLDTADQQVDTLSRALNEAAKLGDGTFLDEHRLHGNVARSRESLAGLCARLEQGAEEAPHWQELHLVKTENSHQQVINLFGELQGGASVPGLAGEALAVDGKEKRKGLGGVLDPPCFQGSFRTKTSKDHRECGLTDIAITPSNQVLVVDKHNKLVKMFSLQGELLRYIGRGFLREPSRVSVLRSTGQILVTDVAAKCVRMFHRDGGYVGEYISDLKFPICCSEAPDGSVVVLEYATKTVIVYDGERALHTFPTEMANPAYMSCTAGGHVMVTDWRYNTARVYDVTGTTVWERKRAGTGSAELKDPHGCCGDGHGHVIVADKGNARVQIYTEGGDHVTTLKPSCATERFKLPYAVTTNRCELLAVAEYQGVVKLYRYIDLPYSADQADPSRLTARPYVLPDDVRVEPSEETAC